MITRSRPKRSPTGARYKANKKKKLFERAGLPVLTRLGEKKAKTERTRGGNKKIRQLLTDTANIYDTKTKQYVKAKIKTILENPANRHYVRRNIMTKGTIIDTDQGKARITNRPGQEGTINAVLI